MFDIRMSYFCILFTKQIENYAIAMIVECVS